MQIINTFQQPKVPTEINPSRRNEQIMKVRGANPGKVSGTISDVRNKNCFKGV